MAVQMIDRQSANTPYRRWSGFAVPVVVVLESIFWNRALIKLTVNPTGDILTVGPMIRTNTTYLLWAAAVGMTVFLIVVVGRLTWVAPLAALLSASAAATVVVRSQHHHPIGADAASRQWILLFVMFCVVTGLTVLLMRASSHSPGYSRPARQPNA